MRNLIIILFVFLSGCAKSQPQYFPAVVKKIYTGSLVFSGNSITVGYPLADESDRYTSVLTAMLGGTEINYGISSSTLEKRSPVDPICCGTNLLDRLSEIPTYTSSYSLLCFMYGMNDWGYNGTNYNPTNYVTDYTAAIENALSKGWPPGRILILSPTYPLDAAFAFYNGINGSNAAPTRSVMLAFVEAAESVATATGVRYLDLYQPMAANTPSGLVSADGVHPNEAGHLFIAQTIYNYLMP